MHHVADAPPAAVTPEGELLRAVYGRLVRWHYTIAAAAAQVSPDAQATMMREMMATLREIGEDPTFRAASDARRIGRGRDAPSPDPDLEARVARLRARAGAGLSTEGTP
jgi:hypothetical protein